MIPLLRKVHKNNTLYADEEGGVWENKNGILGLVGLELSNKGYLSLPEAFYGWGKSAHRLVAKAFHGEVYGFEVDHINGNKLDNRASNLQILPRGEHIKKHKTNKSRRAHKSLDVDEALNYAAEISVYLSKYPPNIIADFLKVPLLNIRSIELSKAHLNKKTLKKTKRRLYKSKEIKTRMILNQSKMTSIITKSRTH